MAVVRKSYQLQDATAKLNIITGEVKNNRYDIYSEWIK
jgi:hypothetical protein